jgi:hypothetical protein
MDSNMPLTLFLWYTICVFFGFSAVGMVLASHWKRLRIMQRYMQDAPLLRLARIEGDVELAKIKRADMQQEINGTVRNVDRLRQRLDKAEAVLEAEKRTDGSEAKLVGLALADRIDALSARMDAVELACGLREKAKTMGGQDG